ncbi:hypothetical protein SALBM311S_09575 [Streptomyces alboniger]
MADSTSDPGGRLSEELRDQLVIGGLTDLYGRERESVLLDGATGEVSTTAFFHARPDLMGRTPLAPSLPTLVRFATATDELTEVRGQFSSLYAGRFGPTAVEEATRQLLTVFEEGTGGDVPTFWKIAALIRPGPGGGPGHGLRSGRLTSRRSSHRLRNAVTRHAPRRRLHRSPPHHPPDHLPARHTVTCPGGVRNGRRRRRRRAAALGVSGAAVLALVGLGATLGPGLLSDGRATDPAPPGSSAPATTAPATPKPTFTGTLPANRALATLSALLPTGLTRSTPPGSGQSGQLWVDDGHGTSLLEGCTSPARPPRPRSASRSSPARPPCPTAPSSSPASPHPARPPATRR